MHHYKVFVVTIFFATLVLGDKGPPYILNAAKNVPRIERSTPKNNQHIAEMGKFFMKASKSVPRIGRRNENFDYDQTVNQQNDKRDQLPIWSDIAERFEYNPELFASPELLDQLEMGDDGGNYDCGKNRLKGDFSGIYPKFQH